MDKGCCVWVYGAGGGGGGGSSSPDLILVILPFLKSFRGVAIGRVKKKQTNTTTPCD